MQHKKQRTLLPAEYFQGRLSSIMTEKKTNVIWSADLSTQHEILNLLSRLGPYILGVKLHSDIIQDYDKSFLKALSLLAKAHNFLIIEDRKFCDIGNTVKFQSEPITKYADLITVHSVSGHGILDGLRENCMKYRCGVLLLAQMSSKGNLISKHYTNATVDMARKNKDIVVGFICQERLDDDFIHFTPGVKLGGDGDNLGQQYNTPEYVVNIKRSDVLIVGRGIHQAEDPLVAVKKYIYIRK